MLSVVRMVVEQCSFTVEWGPTLSAFGFVIEAF
jgi:hypothetical protein